MINDAALDYMREHALAGPVVQQLAAHPQRRFADQAAWTRHLEQLGIASLLVIPDPVGIATEGALWGAVSAHGFLCEAVVVSDDAGQFDIGRHAAVLIHAERLVHKLDTFTDAQRVAQQHVRGLIWWFYADLKAYRLDPAPRRRCELRARFGRIFRRHTGVATLDRLLQRLHANTAELLMVLDHPVDTLRGSTPLHTNGSENDIGCQVTKRHVSAGTRTDAGRDCLPRPRQDLSQARRRLLGLPRRPARCSRRPNRPDPARPHPLSRGASLKPLLPGVLPRLQRRRRTA